MNMKTALFRIWNINLCNHCGKWEKKTTNLASKIAEIDRITGNQSALFGFCEVKNEVVLDGLRQVQAPRKIQCGNIEGYFPECFGKIWKEKNNLVSSPITEQYGELGIVANGDIFKFEGNFIKEKIAKVGFMGRGAPLLLLGARLIHKETGNVFPFYVTHTRGGDRVTGACENIVNVIRDNWKKTDMLPVVVGDFNFTASDASYWAIMEKYFNEVAKQYNHEIIEHFWVGRTSKFQGTGLVYTNRSFELNDGFIPSDQTDHRCPSLEIETKGRGVKA